MNNRKIIKDNKAYIRVSDIVGLFRGCFDPRIREVVEQKAIIGSEVHNLCSQYALGRPCEKTTNARVQKYFECFKEYYDDHKLFDGVLITEERFFDDELMITGQVDFVFKLKNRKSNILVDIKTTAKTDEFHWWLQGILYARMLSQAGIDLVDSFTFIQLSDNPKTPANVLTFPGWKAQVEAVTESVKELLQFPGDIHDLHYN